MQAPLAHCSSSLLESASVVALFKYQPTYFWGSYFVTHFCNFSTFYPSVYCLLFSRCLLILCDLSATLNVIFHFGQCSFASCQRSLWHIPRHPVAHSHLSDWLHSLFHSSHPRSPSCSPPSSLHSHFPSSLKNDSRKVCLINAPKRERDYGKTQRSFQNMEKRNGDSGTISWSSFSHLRYCIRSLPCAVGFSHVATGLSTLFYAFWLFIRSGSNI